jgi:uncharacterized membrane protein
MHSQPGNLSDGERFASAVFGVGLTMIAARRGGPLFRLLVGLAGTSLVGRAIAGHCGMKAAVTGQSTLKEGMQEQWRHTTRAGSRLAQSVRRGGSNVHRMHRVEKTIEVDQPVSTVYNQWTQFEEFPKFMAGVREVRQTDDTHLHWQAEVFGKHEEWDAEITEQEPDKRISWKSVSGPTNAGTVRFEPITANRTRVRLVMSYAPDGAVEAVGSALGALNAQLQTSVEQFKRFIESRGNETGAWRGEVSDSHARGSGH